MKRLRLFTVLVTAALLAAAAGAAGPVSLVRGADGDRLVLDPAFGASWQEVNVGRLVLRTPGFQTRLATDGATAPSAKTRALAVEPTPDAGCALIVADLGPGFEKGRPDAWRRITHATKIVTCADGGSVLDRVAIEARRDAGGMLMAKTGSRAELQPLANPATLRPGADLPLRAFCDGALGTGVELAVEAPDGSRRYAGTDAVGAAVIRVDAAGRWRFELACPQRSAGAVTPQLVAVLVVDVLGTDAWSRLEARR